MQTQQDHKIHPKNSKYTLDGIIFFSNLFCVFYVQNIRITSHIYLYFLYTRHFVAWILTVDGYELVFEMLSLHCFKMPIKVLSQNLFCIFNFTLYFSIWYHN